MCALFLFHQGAQSSEPLGRGLFVSVIQEPPTLSSRGEISKLINFAGKAGIKTLYVQVYRANQAWFPSKLADTAPYKACLKNISADPFRLLIDEAHASGIQVYAWLNLLSLGDNKKSVLLKKYGPGILTRNAKAKKILADYKIDDQYFLEPGDPRVREELSGVVEEVLAAYPALDGVQFDYVRYPDVKPAYGRTEINIERFKKATGNKTADDNSKAWKDWKRAQVTEFLKLLVQKTRAIRPRIRISATGCMPYSRAYYEAFQDWPSWINSGLVDSVTVMDYSVSPPEFERWIRAVKDKSVDLTKVNIGIGAYKLTRSPGIFEREFKLCEKTGSPACVIFHYGSLVQSPELERFLERR